MDTPHSPAEASKATPVDFACPFCGMPCSGGIASIQGVFWPFRVIFGFHGQHLWFKPFEAGKEQRVLESGGTYPAFRCSACGVIIIREEARWFPST